MPRPDPLQTRRGGVAIGRLMPEPLATYARSHGQQASRAWQRIIAAPLQSLLTLLVIAIALTLPALLYLAVGSLQQLSDSWDGSSRINLFLNKHIESSIREGLVERLSKDARFEEVVYISPEQGFETLWQRAGFQATDVLLEENPLPPVIEVLPSGGVANDSARMRDLRDELLTLHGVAEAQLDFAWLERARGVLGIARQLTGLLAIALALGVLLVVGNTIRLEIENRHEEIRVVKLVGGTDAYVRRPFLYSGLLYGLLGGVLACIAVVLVQWWIGASVARLAALYQSGLSLQGLGFGGCLLLAGGGAGLGLAGARLAAGQHLRELEAREKHSG